MAKYRSRRRHADRQIDHGVSVQLKSRPGRTKPALDALSAQVHPLDLAGGSRPAPIQLLQLQRSHGNRYVQRYLARLDAGHNGTTAPVARSGISVRPGFQAGAFSSPQVQRSVGPAVKAAGRPWGRLSRLPGLIQAKKESLATTIAGLKHPKISFLNSMMTGLTALRAHLDAPAGPLKTKKERKDWKRGLWKRLSETSAYGRYKETKTSIEKWVVWLIGGTRHVVDTLTAVELKVSEDILKKIRGFYHRKLNAFSPYFTQMANMNILWKGSKTKNEAWRRTCNMTSLGMTLQSLGLKPADFGGDKAMLLQIAQHFDASFKTFADLEGLRMPDFLQFVAIYLQMPKVTGKDFGKRVEKARTKAAPLLSTSLTIFEDVAGQFNVKRAHTGFIASTGSLKKKDPDAVVATATYKRNVKKQLEPWLDQGGQVVANKPGHYVRLENIDDSGIVIDDPATKGKNFRMTWAKANEGGYFRSYMVFLKK